MKNNRNKDDGGSRIELYKSKMKKIGFMQKYLTEPEIFNFGSQEFKDFLIHTFTNLHSNFNYLSFLTDEDIDQELIRVLEILQILPGTCRKSAKVFDDWTQTDIHKFWMKLLAMSDIEINESYTNENHFGLESKVNFLKGINSTLQYLQHDFPVINPKKLINIDLDDEINTWNDKSCVQIDSKIKESSVMCSKSELLFNINSEKLITDLKFVITNHNKLNLVTDETKCDNIKSLQNLINLTEAFVKYNKHLNLIELKTLKDAHHKYLEFTNENDKMNNLFFIKTYSSIVNILRSKMKLLY